MIDEFVVENPNKAIAFTSLGQLRYLSALQYVDAVIGNSSSGIVEAPSFKLATINIGNRQRGRVRANSVIDISADTEQLLLAINTVYSPEFKSILNSTLNPYGQGNSSRHVVEILKYTNLESLKTKPFYDIPFCKK